MKFRIENDDGEFRIYTDDEVIIPILGHPFDATNTIKLTCTTEKEVDDFIISHDRPIIQILPNGTEMVICE